MPIVVLVFMTMMIKMMMILMVIIVMTMTVVLIEMTTIKSVVNKIDTDDYGWMGGRVEWRARWRLKHIRWKLLNEEVREVLWGGKYMREKLWKK